MYLRHFTLTHFPFDHSATPETLFAASAQAEADTRLRHLFDLRGIGLVTGESGSGKTTICRTIVNQLHPGLHRVMYAQLTTGNVLDMYKVIAHAMGIPEQRNRASAFRAIREQVTRLVQEGRQLPILVIDEAHHLRNEVLEDLRLLTNFAMDSENRLCLLFIGLSELRRRLAMTVHESLNQRVVMRYHLDGLTREELPQYLAHRLEAAGASVPLFEPDAEEAIYQATQALPRKVNHLAHYALTCAAIEKTQQVNAEHVQKAMHEIAA